MIVITFKHPDPQIVQPVLQEIINDYFQKHREIHSVGGQFDDALAREGSALSQQLSDTEQQLANLKNKANIISLDDSRKGLADQISKIRESIYDAQAELVGYVAVMKPAEVTTNDKSVTATNVASTAIPPEQIDSYKSICASLDALHKKEQDYVVQGFTSSNSLIMEVDAQIADLQKAKGDLQEKYPQITDVKITPSGSGGSSRGGSGDANCASHGPSSQNQSLG